MSPEIESSGDMTSSKTPHNPPLCVDLDGSLIFSDLLFESAFALLKQNALYLFLFPVWLMGGRANLKFQIAQRAPIDVSLLPYNQELLDYLSEEKAQGRQLVLATASNLAYAEQISSHLGIFDDVLCSDAHINMSGATKRAHLVDRWGEKGFDYVGNAAVDLPIWQVSRHAIVVNPDSGVEAKARQEAAVSRVFPAAPKGLMLYLTAMRVHQWVKNILIFVPLIVSHQLFDVQLATQSVLAFFVFGLCASSVYLLNDMLDLPADRQHETKSQRPLASGTLPIQQGLLMIPALLLASVAIAIFLPLEFQLALALYYAVTLAYSLVLKQVLLVDLLVLAGLYTMRIIAGAAAIALVPSFWLLAFSMFFFYSLALVKRCAELISAIEAGKAKVSGRSYKQEDLEGLAQTGIVSGFLAILVFALYINSSETAALYTHPEALWLLCPLMLYWINRVWLLTRRDKMHDDPVVFAIYDRRSHWIALIAIGILALAI